VQVEAVGSISRHPLRDDGKWASQELTHKVHTFFKLTHYPDLAPEQKENGLLRGSDLHGGFQHVTQHPTPNPQSDTDKLKAAADRAIAACSGDAREAVKALIVANHFLETDLEKLQAAVSTGYAQGKLFETIQTLPRDREDWYD
jgi:hypothetical protein